MDGVREAIAHAATPWEWRTRGRVVLLVVVMAALTVYATASAVIDGWNLSNTIVLIAWRGGLSALLLLWPSIRSLRRWDAAHAAPPATT